MNEIMHAQEVITTRNDIKMTQEIIAKHDGEMSKLMKQRDKHVEYLGAAKVRLEALLALSKENNG